MSYKITYNYYSGNSKTFSTIKEAVSDALTPSAYSYEGTIEGLSARIDKLQEMLASLIEELYNKDNAPDATKLERILNYGYTVENE